VARSPAEVFPWLVDADKVRQWMGGLRAYEPLTPPPLSVGSRIRQELEVSGQSLGWELEITRLDPPGAATLAFAGSGFKAQNEYTVAANGSGSSSDVMWVITGDTTSFKAKLIAPMVQSKLQEKLGADLARLRALLG